MLKLTDCCHFLSPSCSLASLPYGSILMSFSWGKYGFYMYCVPSWVLDRGYVLEEQNINLDAELKYNKILTCPIITFTHLMTNRKYLSSGIWVICHIFYWVIWTYYVCSNNMGLLLCFWKESRPLVTVEPWLHLSEKLVFMHHFHRTQSLWQLMPKVITHDQLSIHIIYLLQWQSWYNLDIFVI